MLGILGAACAVTTPRYAMCQSASHIHITKRKQPLQMGTGTSNQRIVEPGKGLVGQAVAAGTAPAGEEEEGGGGGGGGGILVTNDPSKEKAFVAEFDMPSPPGEGTEAAGDW